MKSLTIASINDAHEHDIKEIDAILKTLPQNTIDCVNWPQIYNYCPLTTFSIAHSLSHLYVRFHVKGEDLRAVNTNNLSPVAQDSCVEFFMQVPGNPEYWNFEFNCIGTVNASHRIERPKPIRLNDKEIESIKRFASCGTTPFEERSGIHEWSLAFAIPFSLIGISAESLPTHIMANFYKCADATSHPHYVSWNPIHTEKPNFHSPHHFAKLSFE